VSEIRDSLPVCKDNDDNEKAVTILTMGMPGAPLKSKMRPPPFSQVFLRGLSVSLILLGGAEGFSAAPKPLVSRPGVSQSRCTTMAQTFALTLPTTESTIETDSRPGTLSSIMRIKESPGSESLRDAWTMLVPPVWETKGRGVDVRVQWNGNDDDSSTSNIPTTACGCVIASPTKYGTTTAAARAATTLLHELQHQSQLTTNLQDTEKMKEALTESMQLFHDFCQEHVKDASHFQVRVTSSRGIPGIKCPVWHMDHVPVRWIQSLVGPGCMWVGQEDAVSIVEQWNSKVDNDDDDDEVMTQSAKERNHQLIGPTATVHQAIQGEAVMLIGNRWSELAISKSQSDSDVSLHTPAAIHKSPDQLLPWQGRVLLTMDVLYD
jgi:hypothetical protein